MNRRSFFNVVTGIAAGSPLAKALSGEEGRIVPPAPGAIMSSEPLLPQSLVSGFTTVIERAMLLVKESALYDRFCAWPDGGQCRFLLFHQPIGYEVYTRPGAGIRRTLADTNMIHAARLPDPQEFLIESVRIHFAEGSDPADVNRFCQEYILRFQIGSRVFLEAALEAFRRSPLDLEHGVCAESRADGYGWSLPRGISFSAELFAEQLPELSTPLAGYLVLEGLKSVAVM